MSDYHNQNPRQSQKGKPPEASWEQEPFVPYDDPFINPEGTGAPFTDGERADAFQLGNRRMEPAKPLVADRETPVLKPATPAATADAPAPRRLGRVARLHEGAVPPPNPPEIHTQPVRRQADANERTQGLRTAVPPSGGNVRQAQPETPFRAPVHADAPQRPRPQAQPPRQVPPVNRQRDTAYGWPEPSEQPPLKNPFDSRKPPRRSGRGWFILLIVLVLLGGAFAGVWLPNWDGVGGTVGETMRSLQATIKDFLMPEEIAIRSFSVQPDTGTAPMELSFSILATTATHAIRIVDDEGGVVLEKTITDQDRLLGTVTKNSDGNIWILRTEVETAYTGNLTAQAMKKDATWDETGLFQQAVRIEPPRVLEPPVQDFLVSTVADEVPVNVSFSIVTSLDVSAVRIVNDYGDEIAELTVNDAGMNMTQTDDTRVWTLEALMEEPYAGSLYVGYELLVGEGFTQADYREDVEYAPAPIPEDTAAPQTAAPADATQAPTAAPTVTPEPTPSPSPTVSPSPTPEPEPTPTPSPTLMPLLSVAADTAEGSGVVSLKTTAYDGTTKASDFSRTTLINMLDADRYAIWDQSGVLTFRGGPLRQNAAFGTVEVTKAALSVLWKTPVEGAMKMNGATLTGVGWPGQAAIVKWPMEVRQLLNIAQEMKDKTALKEVIVGAQNGKVYFLDLTTGEQTREPISLGWPSNGAVSVNTDGSPIAAFGQFYSIKADKTKLDNGLHIYNLLNGKELALLNGRTKPIQTNYSGFSGAPLFDKNTGAMIVGGQNGVFYLADFHTKFDYIVGSLTISPKYQRYTWTAPGQDAKETNVDGSVAMYGPYAFFGDVMGVVQCVDVNTLTALWAVKTGDQIEGTVALDLNPAGTELALYVGNTVKNQGKGGTASFFRFDALTGKKLWQFDITDLTYSSADATGIYASPVVGQNHVSDLVFFTATNGAGNATLYALKKADGAVAWSAALNAPTQSSPVAVYNTAGDAWIVQALADGAVLLMDAENGAVKDTLQLEGQVLASPAVYRNVLILSTTGADPSYIYAITLE